MMVRNLGLAEMVALGAGHMAQVVAIAEVDMLNEEDELRCHFATWETGLSFRVRGDPPASSSVSSWPSSVMAHAAVKSGVHFWEWLPTRLAETVVTGSCMDI